MTNTIHYLVFDIDDETTGWLQHIPEDLMEGQKPIGKRIGVYTAIMPAPRICVGQRGNNEINFTLKWFEFFSAVTQNDSTAGIMLTSIAGFC